MDYSTENYPNIKYFQLNFGEVEAGVTKIESVKIVNQSNEKQTYVIQRDSISNPLDCVFHTVECTWSLLPCESYICDISYRPILPNRKYTDYFCITDSYRCCCKIVAQGYCKGPKVTSSKSRLIMICENEPFRATEFIKLINHSNVSAKFMFDVDNLQCPFKINEISGIIKASSSKCFSITFYPTNAGIYKYYMPCLILDQNPIIFELYGFCFYKSNQKYIDSFYSKIENINELDNKDHFKNYMNDFTTIIKNNSPKISLSCNFIDFGQAKIGIENSKKRSPQTVCLSNHNKYDIIILWEKDTSETFSIRPHKVKVCCNQSIIFEIRFDPLEKQCAYSKDLIARIFRVPCCVTNTEISNELLMDIIPEFISIRLIGHTFNSNSYNWIPQYEIPETITMPACIPTLPVYTTFSIRNFGQQSLMFCFIPPTTSHYSVRPMAGLIKHEEDYQLIAVQLFPEAEGNKAYVERWALRLNGNIKNEIYVDFQGYAEEVILFFGNDNSVIFNPVHIGCEQIQPVSIRNPTRHCVKFEYLPCYFPKELKTQQMMGVLHPNETIFHDFIFKPDQLKNYEFNIHCHLSTEIGGRNSIIQIEVFAKSMEGSLIAIPEDLNLGERVYKKPYEIEFKIFNFSSVTIHYLLVCRLTENMQIIKNSVTDIKILPSLDTINPGKGKKVKLIVTPSHPGFHDLTIEYFTRSRLSENSTISITKPKFLCKLNYLCYLPTLQIKDLLYQTEANKGISKIFLWKSLSIDNFNSALKCLHPLQESTIVMTVPLVTLEEHEKFVIKLLLKNLKPATASWSLKQKKTCLCNDQTMRNKFKIKPNDNNDCLYCVHDQSCMIQPKKITLMKDDTIILTITIKDKTLHTSGIFWDLSIGEERHITLNIKLETSIILSGPCLKFNNVYIGKSTYLHYQAVWLFNNSYCDQLYKIEMKNISLINKKNYGIIFTCLNPQGTIHGYARIPVLFGFHPNKFGKFKVIIGIKVGNKESILNIEAESTCIRNKIYIIPETCPLSDSFITPEIIVNFNKHCLVLPTLPTHGKVVKIFMVHNHHQQNVLYFKWKNYEIPGFVKINIEPRSGLIQPQSLTTFLIKILIGFHECSLDIDLFCDFLDVSERRFIEKEIEEKKNLIKQMENEFTITETKLIYSAKKSNLDKIKKPTKFCKTLTLKINVYHSQNLDQSTDLQQQLQNTPNQEIIHKTNLYKNNFPMDFVNVASQIFECIIWDIINSKSFAQVLKENLNMTHNIKYSQLPINIIERKYQTERINFTVPKRYVEDILHTMICMVVHEDFNLEITHFPHPSDIRQISYEKTYMEIHDKLIHFD